ncbi:formin-like protein 7 [Setaria italica]|uniref:formin-like protein 7 n=1 Tax=Setaria italica TaxID=4555 RepID=UPI0006457FBB|nr:formin-like protein 7 [Setaria italica]
MGVQPVHLNGATVKLERAEDTDDCFIREPAWLAHVAIWNLPEEHWSFKQVCDILRCVGTMVEVDPFCIPGFDRSCMRVVVELQHPSLPSRIGVHAPSGRGVVLRLGALAFWPRENQFDEAGAWIPYFGPAPPPPPGPAQNHNANGQAQQQPDRIAPAHQPAAAAQHPPQPHPAPLHPGAFFGASILCFGFINPYPLPPLPTFPLLIEIPAEPREKTGRYKAESVLLLTWHPTDPPNSPPPANSPVTATSEPTPPTPPRTTPAVAQPAINRAPQRTRHSARLAAKGKGEFVDATSKAAQLKTLRDSLTFCSSAVKRHVTKRKPLTKKEETYGRFRLDQAS